MNWINKLERKIGKYAIRNLMFYIMILYGVGFIIMQVNPLFYIQYLSLDASAILHGQVWRIFTFIIFPPATDILYFVIAMWLYYSLGSTLERVWGSFRFNLYFFMGVLGHVLAAILIYLFSGKVYMLGTTYLNFSLFFAFAATFPDMQFLLFFFIPIKAKWLGLFNGLFFLYEFFMGDWGIRVAIIMSFANFLVFFFGSRNMLRINPKEVKRKVVYNREMKAARPEPGTARHKCAVCGRTELDDPNLEFRYCSKCEGNYEYCQDHLYTHVHVTAKKDPSDAE